MYAFVFSIKGGSEPLILVGDSGRTWVIQISPEGWPHFSRRPDNLLVVAQSLWQHSPEGDFYDLGIFHLEAEPQDPCLLGVTEDLLALLEWAQDPEGEDLPQPWLLAEGIEWAGALTYAGPYRGLWIRYMGAGRGGVNLDLMANDGIMWDRHAVPFIVLPHVPTYHGPAALLYNEPYSHGGITSQVTCSCSDFKYSFPCLHVALARALGVA